MGVATSMIGQTFLNFLFSNKTTKNKTDQKLILEEEKKILLSIKKNSEPIKHTIGIFRVQNLLNEVYGLIEPHIESHNIEFLYDIHESIPIEIVGDILALEQILYNLLSTIVESQANSTIIVTFKKINESVLIEIIGNHLIHKEILNENKQNLETTKQLITQIESKFSMTMGQSNVIYSISMPFLAHEQYQEKYYQLPPYIGSKKILFIEDHPHTQEIIGNIFKQFELKATIGNADTLSSIQNFEAYDMIILNPKRLTPSLTTHLKKLKEQHALKIISLETLYGWYKDRRQQNNPLITKYLYKPLSRGMVSGLLHEMFILNVDENLSINEYTEQSKTSNKNQIVHIEESLNITPESFKDFGSKHILLVEDNILNQKIIQNILEKSHIKITLANNGQEALDILKDEDSIDLVLMDINMPTMDGYQATKHIRSNNMLSNLPVVIISGLGFRNEIEEMYIVGADAHLTKPFKIGELYTVLKLFINKKYTKDVVSTLTYEYIENRTILDITKAMDKVKNSTYYHDSLSEVLFVFKYSEHIIKERIIRQEYTQLQEYCRKLFNYTKSIEAKSLNKILKEILILLKNNEEIHLQQYITLYKDEWLETKRNIEHYLESVEVS
ncbi:MAG: response regulator [Sulfurovum sp.]|nr:response regulator [Sulfurovum sp.]